MPNWCSTTYRFHGKKEEIEILNSKIKEWTSKEFIETDFKRGWLGNILHGAGLGDRIDNADAELKLRCRGSLIDIEDPYENDDHWSFDLWTETAWVPMAKMWQAVIERLGLQVKFSFIADECGCELYWIYDPNNFGDFSENQVYIDTVGDPNIEEIHDFFTIEEAIKVLQKFFKTDEDDLDKLIDLCQEYEDSHEDVYFGVHVFELDNELAD